jgi:hypothetical protein
MPLVNPPSLIGVGGDDYALSFAYSYANPRPININGLLNGIGDQYNLNTGAIGGVSNVKPFRSLFFSQSFESTAAANGADGEFDIFIQSIGQLYRIGSPLPNASGGQVQVVTGVVPIIPQVGLNIQFSKFMNSAQGDILTGNLSCTLYTRDVAPFIISGYQFNI